jgi:hypothetical protein
VLLAALTAALAVLVPTLAIGSPAGADPPTILKFDTMAPVTGPYVGGANPIRTVPGGGLPWMITAGTGMLKSDGRVLVHVRGLVLADRAPVPPLLQAPTRSLTSGPSSAARASAPAARPPSPT